MLKQGLWGMPPGLATASSKSEELGWMEAGGFSMTLCNVQAGLCRLGCERVWLYSSLMPALGARTS